MNPVFELKDVSYRYHGSIPALERINLTIRQGESVTILGANGSGKSTLLQLLDGLIFPATGTVKAFGEILQREIMLGDMKKCLALPLPVPRIPGQDEGLVRQSFCGADVRLLQFPRQVIEAVDRPHDLLKLPGFHYRDGFARLTACRRGKENEGKK